MLCKVKPFQPHSILLYFITVSCAGSINVCLSQIGTRLKQTEQKIGKYKDVYMPILFGLCIEIIKFYNTMKKIINLVIHTRLEKINIYTHVIICTLHQKKL